MTVFARKNNIEKINHLNEINKRCREEVINQIRESYMKDRGSAGGIREGAGSGRGNIENAAD